ncbi:MAG TPA: AAA family ATPase [Candidatus Acidoferrales bacterium]|nr:AAA family ATPase [Candidatus Acidoferrales bacterium]
MFGLNSEIGFVVVSGACALLFGVFVFRMKFAKMAGRSAKGPAKSPSGTSDSSAREHQPNGGSTRALISKRPSGILMCTDSSNSSYERTGILVAESLENNQPRRHQYKISAPPAHAPIHSAPSAEETVLRAPENLADRQAPRDEFKLSAGTNVAVADPGSSGVGDLNDSARAESHAKVTPISKFQKRTSPQHEAQPALNNAAGSTGKPSEKAAGTPRTQKAGATSEQTAGARLLKFFGLRQQPFDVTPDPAFLYFSPSHREALASLSQGIEHFRGFMMLIAEPGMGKTMLLNKLMDELGDSARVVFLFQTQYNSGQLLSFILDELEVDHAGMDAVAMHRVLNQALLEEMLRGQRFVLIVDEAQNLQPQVLETIRLLSDFETTHSKLIQIVLAGQPQLAETLTNPSLGQLRQRIGTVSHLNRLSPKETTEYIGHRMRAAGWTGGLPFTRDAQTLIADLSKGIPRTINNLCFNALLQAFQFEEQIVDANIVRKAIEKMNPEAVPQLSPQEFVPSGLPLRASATAPHNSRAR